MPVDSTTDMQNLTKVRPSWLGSFAALAIENDVCRSIFAFIGFLLGNFNNALNDCETENVRGNLPEVGVFGVNGNDDDDDDDEAKLNAIALSSSHSLVA